MLDLADEETPKTSMLNFIFGVLIPNILCFYWTLKCIIYYNKIISAQTPCLGQVTLIIMLTLIILNTFLSLVLILMVLLTAIVIASLPVFLVLWGIFGNRIFKNRLVRWVNGVYQNRYNVLLQAQPGFSMLEFYNLRQNCEQVLTEEVIANLYEKNECHICLDKY
jgi:Ring finger domain